MFKLFCVHQNGSAFPLGSLLGYDIMLWPQPGSDETGAVAPPEGYALSTGATPLLRGQWTEEISEALVKRRAPTPPPFPRCNVLWCSSFGRMLRIVSSVRRPSAPTLNIASGGKGFLICLPTLRIFLPSTVSFPRFSTWVEPLVLWYFLVVYFFASSLSKPCPDIELTEVPTELLEDQS